MKKKFDKTTYKLPHVTLDDLMTENIAAIYYELHDRAHKDQTPFVQKRLRHLSREDLELLSDIMEYFFYPDQAKIAREVFSKALITTAKKVLKSYTE